MGRRPHAQRLARRARLLQSQPHNIQRGLQVFCDGTSACTTPHKRVGKGTEAARPQASSDVARARKGGPRRPSTRPPAVAIIPRCRSSAACRPASPSSALSCGCLRRHRRAAARKSAKERSGHIDGLARGTGGFARGAGGFARGAASSFARGTSGFAHGADRLANGPSSLGSILFAPDRCPRPRAVAQRGSDSPAACAVPASSSGQRSAPGAAQGNAVSLAHKRSRTRGTPVKGNRAQGRSKDALVSALDGARAPPDLAAPRRAAPQRAIHQRRLSRTRRSSSPQRAHCRQHRGTASSSPLHPHAVSKRFKQRLRRRCRVSTAVAAPIMYFCRAGRRRALNVVSPRLSRLSTSIT